MPTTLRLSHQAEHAKLQTFERANGMEAASASAKLKVFVEMKKSNDIHTPKRSST